MQNDILWHVSIGIETHIQLCTQSKLFSGASTAYGAEPNTQACAIDAGFPGVLPVLNREAVAYAIRFGLSVQAEICKDAYFDRKHYFYPDLPKGYQISQNDRPIVQNGHLRIVLSDGTEKTVHIIRAHLEEDAGKLIHESDSDFSLIDLNRAGIPLLEIVSAPVLNTPEEAIAYAKTLHHLARHLRISDGHMQEGSFRCDVNISLRRHMQDPLGTRVELKNLNSFRFMEEAMRYEIARQSDLLVRGQSVVQETRLYDPDQGKTRSMRSKEQSEDYLYFSDPDLLRIEIDPAWIDHIHTSLPELPWDQRVRFKQAFGLNEEEIHWITQDADTTEFFEHTCGMNPNLSPQLIINWLMGDVAMLLKRDQKKISQTALKPQHLCELIQEICDERISNTVAKKILHAIWSKETDSVHQFIEQENLAQISDPVLLQTWAQEIIDAFPNQVDAYRKGKTQLKAFFVGQIMKRSLGRGHPEKINSILEAVLNN